MISKKNKKKNLGAHMKDLFNGHAWMNLSVKISNDSEGTELICEIIQEEMRGRRKKRKGREGEEEE